MNLKVFAERLHKELDQIDFPTRFDERVEAFAKLMDIPRFKAESILHGVSYPDANFLKKLAEELEVDLAWLSGESKTKE